MKENDIYIARLRRRSFTELGMLRHYLKLQVSANRRNAAWMLALVTGVLLEKCGLA